jgi:hypothetical protein
MRARRPALGFRELRLVVPDARSKSARQRIAKDVAGLGAASQLEAMRSIEAVSELDAP